MDGFKEIEQGENSKVKVNYIPLMCQHCENPPCAKNAPEGAVYTREDGIVLFDPEKSKGCREIMENCCYGVVFWNEKENIPQKCGMCAHMLDNGEKAPRCVESCPSKALLFGDLDDPNSEISQYIAQRGDFAVLNPEYGANPSVVYRALPSPFITGEVILSDKMSECCEGAKVVCECSCGSKFETTTDFMGDFQFKHLKEGQDYTITVSYPGYKDFTTIVTLDKARDLG